MSTIRIDRFLKLPESVFPLEESQETFFVIGYYCGNSFRVLCYCESYSSAKLVYEDLHQNKNLVYRNKNLVCVDYLGNKNIEYHLFCIKTNIQRYF